MLPVTVLDGLLILEYSVEQSPMLVSSLPSQGHGCRTTRNVISCRRTGNALNRAPVGCLTPQPIGIRQNVHPGLQPIPPNPIVYCSILHCLVLPLILT